LKFPRLHNHLSQKSLLLFAAGLLLLSVLSSWYFKTQPNTAYHQRTIEDYVHRQQADAAGILGNNELMRKLVLRTESIEEFEKLTSKPYGLFLFAETLSENQAMLFWNTQRILPPEADFNLKDGEYFHKLANGYYVIQKQTLRFSGMSNNVVAYVLIPVFNEYYLSTDYLVKGFVHDADAVNEVSISILPTSYPVFSTSKQALFYLAELPQTLKSSKDLLSISLRIGALIFLLVYFHSLAEVIVRRQRALYGIAFLALVFVVVRMLLYQFPQLLFLRQFELFDPSIFAANNVNSSLGDLLINSVFVCWLVLFAWYNTGPHLRLPKYVNQRALYAIGTVGVFVLIFATFQLANIVKSLVSDSKISFNVTSFFSLDIYTVIGLIVLALMALSYYYFTRLLFRYIFPAFSNKYVYIYFILGCVGLVYLSFRSGNEIVLFHLPVLLWLVLYTLLVSQERFIINRFKVTVAGALFWIFVFSLSLAAIIMKSNREKELLVRLSVAEKYDQLSDQSNDYTMRIANAYMDNRFLLSNFRRFMDGEQNRFIRDSLLRQSFEGYSRRYDTRIYVFDSTDAGVNNDEPKSFAELNTLFTVQSKPTEVADLNSLETSYNRLTYITRRIVRDSSHQVGTVFVISTPRQYSNSEALYPELFRQVSRRDAENAAIYPYAIYTDNLLQVSSSKYPFQVQITADQVPKGPYELRSREDYTELWFKGNNKKVIVVARKKETLIESITLFSYLFCAFLFMVGILQVVATLLRLFNERSSFHLFYSLNIRSQIHGTVIFISILSFLIIGAATISFFITRYNRNNIDRLSRTADIMVREMEKRLKDTTTYRLITTDSTSQSSLQALVNEVADIHNADVNIYDLDGNMEVTSENKVYKEGVLSTKMHPTAFYHLDRRREVQYVQKENISSLEYWSIYATVRNEKGEVVNYLNIPYFSSQIDLKQEISNFLVTIINLNAFIFLIAGVIALFITNTITKSFSVIGEKMKAIQLGRTNEEIVWNRNDEIGVLVRQYNKMVRQLEESAEALAKSEREGAWREMARQVAHEIKNPLTPMKLSIQYLQRAVDTGAGNVKDLTTNVANTLVEQIDHLSKIAADFSQFANIGNRKIELVDLHNVIGILVDLYSSNPKVNITWNKMPGSAVMKADKTQMNRVFTNLLANAVDACQSKEECVIVINERQEENTITISIRDNGEGIPEEMQPRIFTPNFTTKSSGTGLGLAMSKNIVEQANGTIWFETEEVKGTTFYVQLPVIS